MNSMTAAATLSGSRSAILIAADLATRSSYGVSATAKLMTFCTHEF